MRLVRETVDLLRLLRTGRGAMDGWIARAYDHGVQSVFRDVFPLVARDILPTMNSVKYGLDAGCGPGLFTIMAAEAVPSARLIGVDLARTMVDLARGHARQSHASERLSFVVGDVGHLPFPENHFDVVISTGSIKHWSNPAIGLRELHRVLVDGGRAFIVEMNRDAGRQAIAAQRRRIRSWFFRWLYPRVFGQALSAEDARTMLERTAFGAPVAERMLLDGCLWLFEVRKAL